MCWPPAKVNVRRISVFALRQMRRPRKPLSPKRATWEPRGSGSGPKVLGDYGDPSEDEEPCALERIRDASTGRKWYTWHRVPGEKNAVQATTKEKLQVWWCHVFGLPVVRFLEGFGGHARFLA